jgi:hypothetical protein
LNIVGSEGFAFLESLARRLDGFVDVGFVALGNQRQDILGGRVEGFESLARFRRDPFAADEQFLG